MKKNLVSLIKKKKELSTLDDQYVLKILDGLNFDFSVFDKYSSFDQYSRSSHCHNVVSQVRKSLRESYGVFIKSSLSKFEKKIQKICSYDDDVVDKILLSHQSTSERFVFYSDVYKHIFSLLDVSSDFVLLDLACGFNPFSYKFLPLKPSNYLTCDLSSYDAHIINSFFTNARIAGTAFSFDIISGDFFDWLKTVKADVCFLFKALDSFEFIQRNFSKKLLPLINSKYLVVSFTLTTISGKSGISEKRRSWFVKFCKFQGWNLSFISLPNEIFYIINTS